MNAPSGPTIQGTIVAVPPLNGIRQMYQHRAKVDSSNANNRLPHRSRGFLVLRPAQKLTLVSVIDHPMATGNQLANPKIRD
jgi:hypothetical protein